MPRKIAPPPPPPSSAVDKTTPSKPGRPRKHEIVLPNHGSRVARAKMRILLAFLKNPHSTVKWCWEHTSMSDTDPTAPMAKDWVAFATIQTACKQEKWVDYRASMWEDVTRNVFAVAKQEIVQQELEETGVLKDLHTRLITTLKGENAPKAKTLEGVVGAIVKLDKRISEKRLGVAGRMAGGAAPGGEGGEGAPGGARPEPPQIADGLSEAEVQEVAMAIVRKRAGVSSPTAGIPTPSEDSDADPDTDEDDDGDDE